MKKIFLLVIMMGFSFHSFAMELDGKFLSQSGELMFTFKGDSLYVDIAQSHRHVSAFKLIINKDTKKVNTYNAYETFMRDGKETYREVLIRVTRMKNKKYLLEYFGKDKDRDYNSNERYTIRWISPIS